MRRLQQHVQQQRLTWCSAHMHVLDKYNMNIAAASTRSASATHLVAQLSTWYVAGPGSC
jgi:hypothetical protein